MNSPNCVRNMECGHFRNYCSFRRLVNYRTMRTNAMFPFLYSSITSRNQGSLRGKHSKRYNSWDIAAEISEWTKLLPRALPLVKLRTTRARIEFFSPYSDNDVNEFFLRRNPEKDIGSCIEPIVISHESQLKYDLFILLLSSIYVFGRFLVLVTSLRHF